MYYVNWNTIITCVVSIKFVWTTGLYKQWASYPESCLCIIDWCTGKPTPSRMDWLHVWRNRCILINLLSCVSHKCGLEPFITRVLEPWFHWIDYVNVRKYVDDGGCLLKTLTGLWDSVVKPSVSHILVKLFAKMKIGQLNYVIEASQLPHKASTCYDIKTTYVRLFSYKHTKTSLTRT